MRANYEDLSKGIHKTDKFLIHFLSNLLLNGKYQLKNREMHVQFDDTVNLKSDTVNDTVFALMVQNNKITANEISNSLKISLSTVKRRIKKLKERGNIERVGSDKAGYWKVIEK